MDAEGTPEWRNAFTDRARAHWTSARVAELTRGKTLALMPIEAAPLLRAIGLLDRNATMPPSSARKYFQINHMLAVLGPSLRELLAQGRPRLRIVDIGCGRSYLTLLLGWHLARSLGHAVEILGVDRNAALIEECRRRTLLAGLSDVVRFAAAHSAAFDLQAELRQAFGGGDGQLDAVVSLHACDTATDDALALGVAARATLIASAPCCHAELAAQWKALAEPDAEVVGAFAPIWRTPHLRRETAAHVTDAMRSLLLRAVGYEVWTLEFVSAAHTPKNTLIRAMNRARPAPDALAEYDALVAVTGGRGISLEAKLGSALRR